MQRAVGVFVLSQLALAALPYAAAAAQTVVFIAPPQLSSEIIESLDEAVSAHVSLLGAKLVFLTADEQNSGLEERMSQAGAQARAHDAVGVFWIEVRPSGRWFLYIMDRAGAHVVVRPLSGEEASVDARIEAAAVIAGSAADALLKQQSLEARLGVPERSPPPESELRLELAYSGTLFSPNVGWLNGVSVGAGWYWASGPYLGLGYTWGPPIRIEDPETIFEVSRHPLSLHGGARLQAGGGFEVGGEVALGIEFRARETLWSIEQLTELSSTTRVVYFAGLRGVVTWRATGWLAILLRVSPELVFNSFDYEKLAESENSVARVYLSPYALRFSAQLGLAVIR
ncbi:MAG TPA: hypothetical protein VJR89_20740 [Polyangiales bacterium]|nr:hypothetical protein [Polyangiales bacterium]